MDANSRLKECLPGLAEKFPAVKKKNRECSLYGFVAGDGRFGKASEASLVALCRKLMQESETATEAQFARDTYIYRANNRHGDYSLPWSVLQIQSTDCSIRNSAGLLGALPESLQAQKDSMISQGHTDYSTQLYQRRLHIYDNHLKNREGAAKSRLTVKGVTIVDVSDKTQYTTS